MAFDPQEISAPGAKIKVIGVGGGGTNAVSTMIRANIEGVDFVAANTDVQSLRFALAPTKIQIGKELTKGLGAGADPDVGRDAALEDRHEIQETLNGADMVFVTAGMGGGTGTGGASIISQIARESNALTVGVVTKPFNFEGKRRRKHAELGINRLKEHVDTLVVIPNDRLLKIATPDLTMLEAFKMADTVLVNAVRGISDIINVPGTINVDFADVKTVMSSMGHALMGIGTASGENRAKEAARQAIFSPLLEDVDIEGATGILINITAGEKIGLVEINEACSIIEEAAHEDANIIFGAVIDENIKEDIRITVIATGFPISEDEDYLISTKRTVSSNSNKKLGATATDISSSNDEFNKIINEKHTPPSLQAKEPAQGYASTRNQATPVGEKKIEHLDNSDLTRWTLEQSNDSEPEPHVEDKITKEEPRLSEPEVHMNKGEFPSEKITQTPPRDFFTDSTSTSTFIGENDQQFEGLKQKSLEQNQDQMMTSMESLSIDDKIYEPIDSTTDKSPIKDESILFSEQEKLSDDIDKRIDEALELAEKVRSIDRKEDDLDVPAFLRHTPKDADLS